jgi:hypothetical protein
MASPEDQAPASRPPCAPKYGLQRTVQDRPYADYMMIVNETLHFEFPAFALFIAAQKRASYSAEAGPSGLER